MNYPIIIALLVVGLFWGVLFFSLKRAQFILAGASFLTLIGFLILSLQQINIVTTPSEVASDIVNRELEDRQFSRDEIRKIIYAYASQVRQHSPNIFYSVIPISVGCFLIGRFSKK